MDKQLQNEVILGVDTHLDTHVAAIVNFAGKLLGVLATPTTAAGYLQLLSWARSMGNLKRAGVEGTGTYGAGLARQRSGNALTRSTGQRKGSKANPSTGHIWQAFNAILD